MLKKEKERKGSRNKETDKHSSNLGGFGRNGSYGLAARLLREGGAGLEELGWGSGQDFRYRASTPGFRSSMGSGRQG